MACFAQCLFHPEFVGHFGRRIGHRSRGRSHSQMGGSHPQPVHAFETPW
jgi:hypothetical protein